MMNKYKNDDECLQQSRRVEPAYCQHSHPYIVATTKNTQIARSAERAVVGKNIITAEGRVSASTLPCCRNLLKLSVVDFNNLSRGRETETERSISDVHSLPRGTNRLSPLLMISTSSAKRTRRPVRPVELVSEPRIDDDDDDAAADEPGVRVDASNVAACGFGNGGGSSSSGLRFEYTYTYVYITWFCGFFLFCFCQLKMAT
jgi:hypothetical protein